MFQAAFMAAALFFSEEEGNFVKKVTITIAALLAFSARVAMPQSGSSGSLTGTVNDPVSYTHLTLPTNREV